MTNLMKCAIGVALGFAAAGTPKAHTLEMAKMAIEAQQHQMSYGKFSRQLWTR